MTLRKALLMAAVVLLSVPVVPALAHDDEDNGYNSHDRFHDQLSELARTCPRRRFLQSWVSTRAYHRALRDIHGEATDIIRPANTTIIRGHVIMAMAIGVITQLPAGEAWRPSRESPCNPTLRSELQGKELECPGIMTTIGTLGSFGD